jgi:Zn-dependent protease
MPTRKGSIRLFQLFGITVYLHWAWLIVAYFQIKYRIPAYTSPIFGVLEYLTLFLLVLIHEFGHQLACRSVGGKTNDIVLWFLGGVAYVSPPQRPGAQLWSIAAGPLVNVFLIPILSVLVFISSHLGWPDTHLDVYHFIHNVWGINIVLLVFNMMPVYPLDGGQILRSLLWFAFGRARSLLIATIVGFVGVAALIAMACLLFVFSNDKTSAMWFGIMAVFILSNCWGGLMQARALARVANAPRHDGFACPVCKTVPPQGAFWICGKCRKPFDTFVTQGVCPNCGVQYGITYCTECGSVRPLNEWVVVSNDPPKL